MVQGMRDTSVKFRIWKLELYEKGIRVLRFSNRAVMSNLDGVLNAIIYAIDPEKSLWPPQQVSPRAQNSGPSPQSSP
jgi:hypothetical protein